MAGILYAAEKGTRLYGTGPHRKEPVFSKTFGKYYGGDAL